MIKGFYAAVSAMMANANRQQLLAHNVANLDTPGFKQILSSYQDFMYTPVSEPGGNLLAAQRVVQQRPVPIGVLGLGSQLGPEMVDFGQGPLQMTDNPFDFAIEGPGFFQVQTPDGERFTRDGRFLRDAEGNLVTFQGYAVLSDSGQPIRLEPGEVTVSSEGQILVNGEEVARLGVFIFEDPEADLERTEGGLYTALAQPTNEGAGRVAQGYLEMSNANPTQIMAQLIEVARSYEAAQQMVQNQDELLGKTISILGRIG